MTDLARAEPELASRRARGGARARSLVCHAGRARSAPADRSRPDSSARLAGELFDKVGASVVDLNGVAEKIAGALSAHNDAVPRLCTGHGDGLSLGSRMRALGVKTGHSMPAMVVDGPPLTTAGADDALAPEAEPAVGLPH
jgi:hypothetical protein